jgi:hypothetical protein
MIFVQLDEATNSGLTKECILIKVVYCACTNLWLLFFAITGLKSTIFIFGYARGAASSITMHGLCLAHTFIV